MIRFTTPTLVMRLLKPDKTVYKDLVFDYILVTLTSGGVIIEKEIPYEETREGVFTVHYTQEETGQLTVGTKCEIQLNIMVGNERLAGPAKCLIVDKNLHKAVIKNDG